MSAWAVSAATGLAGAVIGAVAALAGTWWQARAARRHAESDARERAYVDLLVAAEKVAFRIDALVATIKARTGLGESVALLMRLRKPIEPMDLHDWLAADVGPLMDAWSRTWVNGSPEGVRRSNAVLEACNEVMAVLAEMAPATTRAKLRKVVVGADIAAMRPLLAERVRHLSVARKELAEHVRAETGRPAAQLFSAPEPGDRIQ